MGNRLKDIKGNRYGKLVVLEKSKKGNDGHIYWKCICDCGKVKDISGTHLRKNNNSIKSCGCARVIDDTGKKYNRLTAIKPENKNKYEKWWYKCDCGKTKLIIASQVRNGSTKSCGCYNIEKSSGSNNKRWKNGKLNHPSGYVLVLKDNHKEYKPSKRYIFEHRKVMELFLGRKLLKHENIHHKNGIKDDNRIENLELWSSSQPRGQRVPDKIKWAVNFLTEQGIITEEVIKLIKEDLNKIGVEI